MSPIRKVPFSSSGMDGNTAGQPPFASYAQVIRMMMPLVRKVVFNDAKGAALWTSDGLAESELEMQVQLLLARVMDSDPLERTRHTESDLPEPVHVLPVKSSHGDLIGVLAVQFGELPKGAAYRQYATVQRMLKPLIDILTHDWRQYMMSLLSFEDIEPLPIPVAIPVTSRVQVAPPEPAPESIPVMAAPAQHIAADVSVIFDPAETTPPLPAALRRVLTVATETLGCTFGTIVIPEQSFVLTHRPSAEDCELNMDGITEAVRSQLLRWMSVRDQPLIINARSAAQTHFSDCKFLAWPVRSGKALLALLVLFRPQLAHDFTSVDADQLKRVMAQLPQTTLTQLASFQPAPVAQRAAPAASAAAPVAPTPAPVAIDATAPLLDEVPVDEAMEELPTISTPALSIEQRLRMTLERDAFELHTQRITPLHGFQQPERFEVLLRMPTKQGLQSAASFIGAAEVYGLMPALDRWVIRRLLSSLQPHMWNARSSRREFCINLSTPTLLDREFGDIMINEICSSTFWPGQLLFEVSEQAAIKHPQAFNALAQRLRDVGCRVALDNCRLGIDLFDHLQGWPVSCIKLDGTLTRQMGIDRRTDSLIETMAQLANGRGIESIAVQVETQRVCRSLLSAGVDYAQGFHLEAPQPLTQLFE